MKKYVKIISGFYGVREGNSIKPKGKNDPPFLLDADEAERLVENKIAVIVDDEINETAEADTCEYGEKTSMPELKKIAKREGITIPVRISKTDLLTLLDEHFSAPEAEMPAFNAEDSIV